MKKLLSLLVCGMLLLGCSKYDDSEIRMRLDNLENTRIPSVESQIAAIQTSLPLLQQADAEIKGYISVLKQSMSDVDAKIKVLQSTDTELEKKISYLDGKIDMQKDWVTATFTTLAQYNGLVADIAIIRTNIEAINKNIADLETRYTSVLSAIDNCMASMKNWINEKLTNYYTIAVIDAKVQLLQNVDSELRNEIETAKLELTAAYENAIKTAIETNNGIIDNKIAQEITTVNNRIDDIETRLSSLEKRIQSISYIPRYNDGQAIMKKIVGQDEGIAEFDFMISPKDAVSELAKVWNDAVTMKAVYTQTRAALFVELPITHFEADTENGIISIKVSGENLSNDYFSGKVSANAALFISDGNNRIISDYIFMPADFVSGYTVYYTSTDGKSITPSGTFGAKIVANTYAGGQGKITLDGNATESASFYERFNLKTIILPNTVTRIVRDGFRFCENLTSITIGNNVEIIGNSAFDGCRSLTTITLPASTKEIRYNAFGDCLNLTSVYCKATIPPTFEECHSFRATVFVPRSSANAYKTASGWSKYANQIEGYDFE